MVITGNNHSLTRSLAGGRAAPTVQGGSAREHRTGPRSSRPGGTAIRDSPDRMGATPPVPRCKRRSQLPQDRAPVRPYVLHPLPCRYGEGDLDAVANWADPPAWNALRAAEQTPAQHQGRSLVHRQPVPLHELHPADDRTVGRVDLKYLHSIPVAAGDEIGLDLAVAETGQHPAVPAGLAFQLGLLPLEVQPLNHDGLARLNGMFNDIGDRVPNQRLSLMAGPAVGHQRDPPGAEPVPGGVRLRYRQVVRIQVHSNRAQPPVRHRGHGPSSS